MTMQGEQYSEIEHWQRLVSCVLVPESLRHLLPRTRLTRRQLWNGNGKYLGKQLFDFTRLERDMWKVLGEISKVVKRVRGTKCVLHPITFLCLDGFDMLIDVLTNALLNLVNQLFGRTKCQSRDSSLRCLSTHSRWLPWMMLLHPGSSSKNLPLAPALPTPLNSAAAHWTVPPAPHLRCCFQSPVTRGQQAHGEILRRPLVRGEVMWQWPVTLGSPQRALNYREKTKLKKQ